MFVVVGMCLFQSSCSQSGEGVHGSVPDATLTVQLLRCNSYGATLMVP